MVDAESEAEVKCLHQGRSADSGRAGLTQVDCLSHSTTALFKVARKLNLASSRLTSSLLFFPGHFQFKLSSKCQLSIPPPQDAHTPQGEGVFSTIPLPDSGVRLIPNSPPLCSSFAGF